MAFNNDGTTFFTSTPAAMASFLSTQTYFTTPPPDSTPTAAPPPATTSNTVYSATIRSLTTSAGTKATTRSTTHISSGTLSPDATANAPIASNSISPSSPTGSTLTTSFTSPAAASATGGAGTSLSAAASCSSISCSPGKQAAVAIPVILVALGIILAFIILARRRRRKTVSSDAGSTGEPRGSKWARHLRVFSFDAELLIGGRSSRATSIRSEPTPREYPSLTSLRSQQPSMRSQDSPAPPYRDALAGGGVQMAMRPDSQLTAPPPYIANRAGYRSNSRLSAISRPATAASDPFADPEEGDEPTSPRSRRSMVRRSSSAYHPVREDDASFVSSQGADAPSEVGSLRNATIARRISSPRPS